MRLSQLPFHIGYVVHQAISQLHRQFERWPAQKKQQGAWFYFHPTPTVKP
jgi:hypothetical protein